MSHRSSSIGILAAITVTAASLGGGCSATNGASTFEGSNGAGNGGPGGPGASGATTGDINPTSGTGTPAADCTAGDDEDRDQDGYTRAQGDCNDCDANANQDAIEVIVEGAAPADEDCSGAADDIPAPCDGGLDLGDADPWNAARAIDVCRDATSGGWGLLGAEYVRANGAPYSGPDGLQHGLLSGFGANVKTQIGERMLGLSSGYARTPGQPGVCDGLSCWSNASGTPPPGFPAEVPDCFGGTTIADDVGLELKLRAPSNAKGYKFSFKFYSFEFAEWVCSAYNDQFIALVSPPPAGASNGNIVFDKQQNPVSVNIAFFDVCDAAKNGDFASECVNGYPPNANCPQKPSPYCPDGPGELAGTGFDNTFGTNEEDAGATAWLETIAPVSGGDEITVRFAIWDTGDDNLDSTVLVDAFQWLANGGEVVVGTDPIDDPK